MSGSEKPRQFWLLENRCALPTRVHYSEDAAYADLEPNDNLIEVIEKSAYDALAEKLKDALAALEDASETIHGEFCGSQCHPLHRQPAVIAKIREGKE